MDSFTDHLHMRLPSSFECILKNAMIGLVATVSVLGASVPTPTLADTNIALDTHQMEEVQYDDFFNQVKEGNIVKVCAHAMKNDCPRFFLRCVK